MCAQTVVADFAVDNLYVFEHDTAYFTDISTGSPTQWQWRFQDAVQPTSSEKNPKVVWPHHGTYTVKLKAANQTSSDSIERFAYIHVVHVVDFSSIDPISNADSVVYAADSGGYVTGNNYRHPLAIAKRIKNPSWGCNGLENIQFKVMYNLANSQYIKFKILDATVTGEPNAVVSSDSIFINQGADTVVLSPTSLYYYTFNFPSDTSYYFLTVELPQGLNDTLAVFSEASTAQTINDAWELRQNQTWIAMSDTASWNMKLDLSIDYTCLFIINSISENTSHADVRFELSPNPSAGELTVKTTSSLPSTFALYDLMGREQFKTNLQQTQQTIDLSFLPAGIYFAKLNGLDACKWVKE